MENELFIIIVMYLLGGITLASGYYVYTSVKIKRAYEQMLERQSQLQSTQSTQFQKWVDKNLEIENIIKEVEIKLKEDGYASLSEINNKIGVLDKKIQSLDSVMVGESKRVKDLSNGVYSEITQLKTSLKKLVQDPNFLNRY